jgi:hypothetical protein
MAYPNTVDIGQIGQLALYDGELAQTASSVGVANTVYLVGVFLQSYKVLNAMRVRFATGGAGHYDLGIYDATGTNGAPGNLLAHAASSNTSLVTSSATLTPAMLTSVNLTPGPYWLAMWIDNATDTFNKQSASGSMSVILSGTSAGPLPSLGSSISSLTNATLKPILIGLFANSWS